MKRKLKGIFYLILSVSYLKDLAFFILGKELHPVTIITAILISAIIFIKYTLEEFFIFKKGKT